MREKRKEFWFLKYSLPCIAKWILHTRQSKFFRLLKLSIHMMRRTCNGFFWSIAYRTRIIFPSFILHSFFPAIILWLSVFWKTISTLFVLIFILFNPFQISSQWIKFLGANFSEATILPSIFNRHKQLGWKKWKRAAQASTLLYFEIILRNVKSNFAKLILDFCSNKRLI